MKKRARQVFFLGGEGGGDWGEKDFFGLWGCFFRVSHSRYIYITLFPFFVVELLYLALAYLHFTLRFTYLYLPIHTREKKSLIIIRRQDFFFFSK